MEFLQDLTKDYDLIQRYRTAVAAKEVQPEKVYSDLYAGKITIAEYMSILYPEKHT